MTKTARALFALGVMNLVGRGTDYLFSPHQTIPPEIVALAPLEAWGVACLIAAGIVTLGLFTGWVRVVVAGGALAAALYVAFAVQRGVILMATDPLSDWREGTTLLAGAGAWIVLSLSAVIRNAVVQARRVECCVAEVGGCDAGCRKCPKRNNDE